MTTGEHEKLSDYYEIRHLVSSALIIIEKETVHLNSGMTKLRKRIDNLERICALLVGLIAITVIVIAIKLLDHSIY